MNAIDTNNLVQVAYQSSTSDAMFTRRKRNGTWGAWQQLAILGGYTDITGTTENNGNLGLSTAYNIYRAAGIRNDSNYYTGFYTISIGGSSMSNVNLPVLTFYDTDGTPLASKNVKFRIWYFA